jgi:hypothetical protein
MFDAIRYFVRAVPLLVLAMMLAAASNASAVIRSPFPSRPSPPYQGHSLFVGSDALVIAPKPAKPTSSSR